MSDIRKKKLKLLVTEDEAINRMYITTILERNGWDIHEASDGQEAIDSIKKNDYDAVLMDISMPRLNGIDATIQIREEETGGQHLPIIALTAHAFPSDRKKFLDAGMDDVVVKPLNEETLIEVISKYVD
ncbi:MAG: response regulator [Spirochaetales bacterium]|uniref:Response regulator n=1 Tax=Candidatus Thalassospirochaeta sargassi TaxID=3119039 RepID=A0AAJ1IF91_9SPIO|nr:response regulator [Spirochaetales bacterium]